MDAQQIGEAFGQAVQWAGLLGLGGVALAALALCLARVPACVRTAARRAGWPSVAALCAFAAVATATGAVTRASKARGGPRARAADAEGADARERAPSALTAEDFARGFVLARIGMGETFSFDAPSNAVVCADWEAFGAAEDWIYLVPDGWSFAFGAGEADRFRVHSSGRVEPLVRDASGEPVPGLWLAPFAASLGLAPEASWASLPEAARPSLFWHLLTPSNTLVMTWRNALLGRRADAPVSFQLELWPSGRFTYRYGFPQTDIGEVARVLVGASLGGPAWTTNALPADVTSLAFHPLTAGDAADPDRDGDGLSLADELFVHGTDPDLRDTDGDGLADGEEVARGTNPLVRDTDGDGFPDGSDPDPLVPTSLADRDGDGIPDAYEDFWFGGTNAVGSAAERDGTGFTLAAKILGGMNPTNAAPAAAADGPVVSWRLFDGFAAGWPPDATNLVWERTFALRRASAWQQLFVSASPTSAAPWRLEGMSLEWETDTGVRGSASASPCADSFLIPFGADDAFSALTLRLRAAVGASVRSPAPLHLIAYEPEFRAGGGREVTGMSGRTFLVFTDDSDARIVLAVDDARRPHRAPPGDDERDTAAFAAFAAQCGGGAFDGGASGGTVRVGRSGVYPIPDFARGGLDPAARARRRAPRADAGRTVVVLSPSVGWRCDGHGCRYDGLGYDWRTGRYAEEDGYPLDTGCLRRKWYRDWHGGWFAGRCELVASGGCGDGGGWVTTTADGDVGRVFVDGVEVWSGTAEHIYGDTGCGGGYEEGLDGVCGGCEADCADGACDSLEGPSLGSLRFRIPLGAPVKGQVAGFVWFASNEPVAVSRSTFRLLAHPDAHVTDVDDGATRRIVCSDPRGRELRIADVAHGVRVIVLDAAAWTLEHTWEIANVDGDPARVRLRKISRLGNVMSDETFACADDAWTRFDNVAGVETRLDASGDLGADGAAWETRTTMDRAGNVLASVTVGRSRVGRGDNAVLRETSREESTGAGGRWARADWWNDPQHAGRHGRLQLLEGNARAWEYHDYDGLGHETLRVSQRNGSAVPASFPCVVSNGLCNADGLADAFVTVRDCAPLPGDSAHADDAAKPRTETRYVVTNGAAAIVGRTWTRYTRLVRGGYDAIKAETWRTGAQGAAVGDAGNAYSYKITYADTGDGTPLLMRNAAAETLDENGVLTVNAYSLSDGVLSQTSRRFFQSQEFPTYETVELNASYGTVLRRTTRLTAGGAVVADERSTYDSQNRLRATAYLDGTSETNAYSCCRLLWKRDREGRKTLRSAATGTDHLYNAMEDVWLADVSTNGQYRVTQRFYDALGRETNTVVYAGTTPGEAVEAAASEGKAYSTVTTAYPYGGSDYAVRTDERGKVTIVRQDILGDCVETVEAVFTNGVEVVKTKSRYYFGGGTSVRREWTATGPDGEAVTAWTEERRLADYAPDGRRVEYVVTASHDCGAVTNAVAVFDLLGREISRRVPGANGAWVVTSNAYDGASSRLLSSETVAGDVVRTAVCLYDACGQPVGTALDGVTNRTDVAYVIDASNAVWRVETSARIAGGVTNAVTVVREQLSGFGGGLRGRAVSIDADGLETRSEKTLDDGTGIETETETASDGTWKVVRRKHGLVIESETAEGRTVNVHDGFGRIVRVERSIGTDAPFQPVSRTEYAPWGDVIAVETFTNGTEMVRESYGYDAFGNRTSVTNALGEVVETDYDVSGNVTAMRGATYPVEMDYDTESRRVALRTTRDGSTWDETRWAYDAATGNCLSKTYADNSTITYTYTPDSLLLRTTYASGRWKENVYGERRQVIGVEYSDGEIASFDYDAFSNEIAFSNDVASASLDRNVQNDCTNDTAVVGDEVKTIRRTFDEFRRLTGIDDTIYGYNADGLLASISNAIAVVDYAYTTDRLDAGYSLTLSNGVAFTRSLDRDSYRRSLVTDISSVANGMCVGSLAYTYDALNRPTTRNADTFDYNARSEVTAANVSGFSASYGYDEIGNSTNWTANSLNQYTQFTYDLDGNMTQCGDWTYTYDAANRLKTVSSNGVLLVTNYYDAKSRRVKKVTAEVTTTFFYDGWNLIEERVISTNGTSSTIRYFWGKDLSGTLQDAGGVGGLLYLTVDGAIHVPCYDNNGNITRYLDASGNTVARYAYNVFGDTLSQSGIFASVFHHRFSTKYYDAETGLYYHAYRFYSPSLMRWLNHDPIAENGGLNLYAFCKNNAIFSVDPYGLDRYMTTFNANPRKDRWHVGVAVDTWKCSDGEWVKTGVVTFDFGVDDSSFWNRLGTYFVTVGAIVEREGNCLARPFHDSFNS